MNEMITTKVAEFAKANRVNKSKLMSLVEDIMTNCVVSAEKKTNTKTSELFDQVLEFAKNNNGVVIVSELRKLGGFNPEYLTKVMVEKGLLVKLDPTKTSTGRGRPSLTFKVV